MIIVTCACIALLAITTLIHYEVLRYLSSHLPHLAVPPRRKLILVIFTTFFAHAAEICLYGLVLYLLIRYTDGGALTGAAPSKLMTYMYLSAETYTSVGFGDIVPLGAVRLLIGVEALNGLLLIGWSASYIYIAMERFWSQGNGN